MGYLLTARASHRQRDPFVYQWLGLFLATWGILVAIITFCNRSLDWEVVRVLGLVLLGIYSALGVPALVLRQLASDAQIHAGLRDRGCSEEVLGTLLRPRQMLDQIAMHSTVQVCKQLIPMAVGILVSFLICEPQRPDWLLKIVLGLVVGVPATTFASSYLGQQLVIFQVNSAAFTMESGLTCATCVPALATACLAIVALLVGNSGWFVLGFALYALAGVTWSRELAARGMEALPQLRLGWSRLQRRLLGARNRFVPAWGNNPVVIRERTREARHVPFQWLGSLFYHLPLTAILLLLVRWVPLQGQPEMVRAVLFLAFWLQLGWSSKRSGKAIVSEIQAKTMEPLQNTRLHAREFVRGWLEVAAFPRILDGVVVALLALALAGPGVWDLGLLVVVAPCLGATAGLYASCSPNTEIASKKLGEVWTVMVIGSMAFRFCSVSYPILNTLPLSLDFLLIGVVVGAVLLRMLLKRIDVTAS